MMPSPEAWHWAVLGAALMALEVLVPGAFLVWFGLAALVMAALTLALPLGLAPALLLFAALSVVAVLVGRAVMRRAPLASLEPEPTSGGERLVGRVVTVTSALSGGAGRVKVGDSEWRASGPDLAAGSAARVVAAQGSTLVVEPA